LEKVLDAAGQPISGMETSPGSGWLVVDAFQIMVHIFSEEQRGNYRLEQLWKDAEPVSVKALLNPRRASPVKKKVVKKAPARKTTTGKKAAVKKTVTKKVPTKKAGAKEAVPKRTTTKKAAPKRKVAKKS
jgi:ribosome-associated protein